MIILAPWVASGSPIVGPIVIVALNFALYTVPPLSFPLGFFFLKAVFISFPRFFRRIVSEAIIVGKLSPFFFLWIMALVTITPRKDRNSLN